MDNMPADDFASAGMRVYNVRLYITYPRWYGSKSYTKDVEVEAPVDASARDILDIATNTEGIDITSPESGATVRAVVFA